MFARMIEFTPKPDKTEQLMHTMTTEVLPLLKKHPGFVDMFTMVPEHPTGHFVTISFWKTKEMANEYHNRDYPRVIEMLKPFMTATPTVTFFTVETSTFHKIAVAA
ncbi:MAG: antibiotic biosynthesis monooxygenase family protein [Acidobacteriota bacterium]